MPRKFLVLASLLGIACGKSVVPAPADKPVPDLVAPTGPASSAPQAPSGTRFVLTHATVIDVSKGEAERDRDIVVDGDEIVAVVASGTAPDATARPVDARGKYVVPGLWDMHVHFADPDSGKLFIANGVTGVRVMWGNPPFYPGMNRFQGVLVPASRGVLRHRRREQEGGAPVRRPRAGVGERRGGE